MLAALFFMGALISGTFFSMNAIDFSNLTKQSARAEAREIL